MKPITSTDARRYLHFLTSVFNPEMFFLLPFTAYEFTFHNKYTLKQNEAACN